MHIELKRIIYKEPITINEYKVQTHNRLRAMVRDQAITFFIINIISFSGPFQLFSYLSLYCGDIYI